MKNQHGTGNEDVKMKEQFSKIDASLKELLQICKNAPTNNKTAYNYVQQYNSIMVDYQTKLQNIKAQRRLNNKSFNSAVSKFQAAHSATNKNGKEGVGPKNSWKKATKSALASRKVPQKRNLAHRGSPMELLAQLDRMGIDQNELNISFKKVYEEKMKQKNRQDDGLNTERAKILLLDAFATRDPNHILLSRFDITMYQWISSATFNYFYTILALIHMLFVFVEHNGHGLLSKDPDKYMWSFDVLCPLEFAILILYFFEFASKSKLYKKLHPWLITYGVIIIAYAIDLGIATTYTNGDGGADARKVMRLTRSLRPFFLLHRWRPLRNMIHEIVVSVKRLIPVLVIIAFIILVWALFGIMLFPRTCANVDVHMDMMPTTCPNTDWLDAFTPYNASTIQSINTTKVIDIQCQLQPTAPLANRHLCKQLKTIPTAYLSEGKTYFPTISAAYMQLLYLLFGSVNYPDIQLPAQLTIHIFYISYFMVFIIIGIILLNMMLAQVFEGWKEGAERLLLNATKKQRLALIECFILMDKDSGGTIDFDEFKTVVAAIRPNEEALLQIIFNRLSNGNGTELDINKFMNICDELWLNERKTMRYLIPSEYDMPATISDAIFAPEIIQHWHRAREYRRYRYEKHFKKGKNRKRCCYRFLNGGLCPQLRVVLRQSWFEIVILLIMMCAALTFYYEIVYTVQCNAEEQKVFHNLEWIPLILLLCETLVKILAVGLRGFLTVTTWKIDAVLVISAFVGQILFSFALLNGDCLGSRSDRNNGISRFTLANMLRFGALLRLIRVFRFLSSRKSLPGSMTTRVMYKTFRSFVPSLIIFIITYCCLLYVYAIVGVYYLGGKVFTGKSNNIGGIANAGEFAVTDGNIQINVKSPYLVGITFNTFVGATFTLWSVTVLNNWHIIHHAYASTTTNGSDSEIVLVTLFFVSWILLSAMVWLNLLVSAFLEHYSNELEVEKKISTENLIKHKEKYIIKHDDKRVGQLSQFGAILKSAWLNFVLFFEESLGTTRICTLSGQAMSSFSCPLMILPQIFDTPKPKSLSVMEFLKLCDEDGRMETRRFTHLHEQSLAKMDFQSEHTTGKESSLILIKRKSSGAVDNRDGNNKELDEVNLLFDQGDDMEGNKPQKKSFEVTGSSSKK